ncbi:MAG: hypothetical protein IH885_09160, partial [Myxococcales bacterium]|nr:hypothetical protein [Myxococcales bacterium]
PESHIGDGLTPMLEAALPDIEVHLARSAEEAQDPIEEADAAFGNVVPELFARAKKLRWIMGPQAGPDPSFYHSALVESAVTVTNMRGIFDDHISAHILGLLLTFARGLHVYHAQQAARKWRPAAPTVHLPEATALIVGVGGIGAETARLCAEFHMTVLAIDPRVTEPPPGVAELAPPERLDPRHEGSLQPNSALLSILGNEFFRDRRFERCLHTSGYTERPDGSGSLRSRLSQLRLGLRAASIRRSPAPRSRTTPVAGPTRLAFDLQDLADPREFG